MKKVVLGALALIALPVLVILAFTLRRLPRRWALAFGRGLGWCWYRLVPVRRRVARRQVALAFGAPREQVVAEMYAELGMHFVELACGAHRGSVLHFHGLEHLHGACEDGGVLLLSAHLGPWEALIHAAAAAQRPVHVVSKRLSLGWADRLWRRWRAPGVSFLEARGSGRAIIRALRRGEIVAMVLDQHDPRPEAAVVPFFGRAAATSLDLARLSSLSKVPVVPVFVHRRPDGLHVNIEPPLSPPERTDAAHSEATSVYTACIESAIRDSPGQWLWIHRRWKADDRLRASAAERAVSSP